MRASYPLYLDLMSLSLEAATEPQRNLHFPLFRHAGTRVPGRVNRGRFGRRRVTRRKARSVGQRPENRGGSNEFQELCAAVASERADRAAPATPQMALFADAL